MSAAAPLTAAWLAERLTRPVTHVEVESMGSAGGLNCSMVRLVLTCQDGDESSRHTMVLKRTGENGFAQSKLLGLAREAHFYQSLAKDPRLKGILPEIYYASGNMATGEKEILMEDLKEGIQSGYFFGPTSPLNWEKDLATITKQQKFSALQVAKAAARSAAHLHGAFWRVPPPRSSTWLRGLQWVADEGESGRELWEAYQAQARSQWAALDFAAGVHWDPLLRRCIEASIAKAKDGWETYRTWLRTAPWSVVHGDFHPANCMLLEARLNAASSPARPAQGPAWSSDTQRRRRVLDGFGVDRRALEAHWMNDQESRTFGIQKILRSEGLRRCQELHLEEPIYLQSQFPPPELGGVKTCDFGVRAFKSGHWVATCGPKALEERVVSKAKRQAKGKQRLQKKQQYIEELRQEHPAELRSIGLTAWHYKEMTIGEVKQLLKAGCLWEIRSDCDKTVTIPGSVTRIGTCAFKSCTSLSCVALPEALTEIGGYAFIGCSSLEHVRIPRKVTRIGEGAFAGCASLTILTIPDSVTEIGEGAFARCSSLKHVVIPKSVTQIGRSAFADCKSLSTVELPEPLQLSESVFEGCSLLSKEF
ncbi:Putative surface protein bspA-like (TvBspA-like-625) [Durusdinium trenchii]|uniref:Surface protein bspA-like (TvBspA-like-625) n=1 Tax=Durusdinium trenchii TaxID=1381693 RepID=A0ABP0SEF5_9DINO